MILLCLLAFGLRLPQLGWQPLWWDEGYSLYAAAMPIGSMITETAEDIHPPLYYALLHLWQSVLGGSPVAARLLSASVGVLTVLLIFQVGKRWGGVRLGFLAGLLVAVNPFQVYYSQEVRMYALVALLGLLSAHLMLLWLESQSLSGQASKSRRLILAYLVVTLVALYTHYYAVFIPLAETLFVLLFYRRHRLVRLWLAYQGLLAVLYLPWIIFTALNLTSYVSGKVAIEQYRVLGPLDFLWRHVTTFALGHLPDEWSGLYWAGLLSLILALLGAVLSRRTPDQKRQAGFWAIFAVLPVLGAFAINLVYPFSPRGFERLILFAAPAYCLLVARGSVCLWQRQRLLTALMLAAVLAASGLSLYTFYTTPRYTADDYRPLIDQVRRGAWPGDAVLCLYPWQMGYFESYYGPDAPDLEPAFRQDWPARQQNPSLLPSYIDGLMARHKRLWFPAHQTGGRILEGELEQYLAARYHTVVSEWANPHTRLYLFSAPDDLVKAETGANFGDRLRLVGSALNREPVRADGGIVNADLQWQLVSDLQEPYYVGLRLTDDSNYTWAQRSAEPWAGLKPFSTWPIGEVIHDTQGLLLPADIPPGQYQVKAGVYRRSDGRGLDIIGPAGNPQGVEASLGTVEVGPALKPPTVSRLDVPETRTADLSDRQGATVRLLGYSLPGTNYVPGSELSVVLFWEPATPVTQDNSIVIQLVGQDNQTVAQTETPPVFGHYPMTQWKPGYPVRDPHRLVIPPDLAPGTYTVRVGMSQPATGERFLDKTSGYDYVDLGSLQVGGGRAHDFKPPQVAYPLHANLGEGVQILGYDMPSTQLAPGAAAQVTLHWKALAPMATSYTVFVHLLDKDQRIWGQVDSPPGNGTLPTTGWVAGEYLRDTYSFQVKPDAPPGVYALEIGMYDAASGQRLPVRLEGQSGVTDHILLNTEITVR